MRFGRLYSTLELSPAAIDIVRKSISSDKLSWQDGIIHDRRDKETERKTEISWIRDEECAGMVFSLCQYVNKLGNWNLKITGVEPLQYGLYGEGGLYNWHIDQHSQYDPNGNIRKISMTIFLNDPDEYEGGEFDLEIYKPGVEPRFESFKLKKWSAIFFPSDQWHRVRPVTSGLRKSLVAWFYGPPYV